MRASIRTSAAAAPVAPATPAWRSPEAQAARAKLRADRMRLLGLVGMAQPRYLRADEADRIVALCGELARATAATRNAGVTLTHACGQPVGMVRAALQLLASLLRCNSCLLTPGAKARGYRALALADRLEAAANYR